MKVTTRLEGRGVVIKANGDVDLYTSPKLREAIIESIESGLSPIVVNLEGVTYIDSSGVATLVEGFQLGGQTGCKFRLASMSGRVAEVVRLARLDQFFEIYETEAEALGNGSP